MIDFLAKRDIIEQIIPSDAPNTVVTSGVSGAWSAYAQVIAAASLTYPFILCGAYVYSYFSIVAADGTQVGMLNLQVATGEAASEVPIAEGHSGLLLAPGANDSIGGLTGRTLFFEPILVPPTTRLSIRASASSTRALYNGVYLFGYDARYFAQPLKVADELRYIRGLCSPTQGATVWPSPGGTNVTTHATSGYVYGTPVQFIASAASPLLITGLFGYNSIGSNRIQAKIGIGAAGSEQWMSKVALPVWSVGPGPFCDCYLPRPLYVKTGEAVSVTIAGHVANKITAIALKGFALK